MTQNSEGKTEIQADSFYFKNVYPALLVKATSKKMG